MAKIIVKNTRRHDVHINYADPKGPTPPGTTEEEKEKKVPGAKPLPSSVLTIPASRPHPTRAREFVHGQVEVDEEVIAEARKKHPAVDGMFEDGWLLLTKPAPKPAPAAPQQTGGQQQDKK